MDRIIEGFVEKFTIADPVHLLELDAQLQVGGEQLSGKATVSLNWNDGPSVELHWAAEEGNLLFDRFPDNLVLNGTNYAQSWGTTGLNSWESGFSSFDWNWSDQECVEVVSHVCLFPQTKGESILAGNRQYCGRYHVQFSEWRLDFDCKPIDRNAGDRPAWDQDKITHLVRLRRVDGLAFQTSAAEDILHAFHWFLSFCRAGFTQATLFSSSNENGVMWKALSGDVRPLGHPFGWFKGVSERHKGKEADQSFESTFKLFLDKWLAAEDELKLLVSWYCTASASGRVEQRILSLIAGLEQLYFPDERKGITTLGQKIDRFNHDHGVVIPLTHLEITSAAQGGARNRIVKISELLPNVRNKIAHGKRAQHINLQCDRHGLLVETWLLALKTFELSVLAFIGHRGLYTDPTVLSKSDVSLVPWANAPCD